MTQADILYEFKQMSIQQQLETLRTGVEIIEANFHRHARKDDEHLPLPEAAKMLLDGYKMAKDLTGFASLDGEDFHATW